MPEMGSMPVRPASAAAAATSESSAPAAAVTCVPSTVMLEAFAQRHDDAADALVADEQVGAVAHDGEWRSQR